MKVRKIQRSKERLAFSRPCFLSFGTTSIVSKPQRIHIRLISPETTDRGDNPTSLLLTCSSPSIWRQLCLKTRASTLNDYTWKTVGPLFNAKWLFKVIQGHMYRCRWKATGDYITNYPVLKHYFGLIYNISKDRPHEATRKTSWRKSYARQYRHLTNAFKIPQRNFGENSNL